MARQISSPSGHYPTMSLASAKKRFTELSGLRREGETIQSRIIDQEEQKGRTDTVGQACSSIQHMRVCGEMPKKPLQIKQQIDADMASHCLATCSLYDKIQTIDIAKALDKIVAR